MLQASRRSDDTNRLDHAMGMLVCLVADDDHLVTRVTTR